MDDREQDLKLAINNLIWMHAPSGLTLGNAEKLAAKIYFMIAESGNGGE